jgi:hypothetical protein
LAAPRQRCQSFMNVGRKTGIEIGLRPGEMETVVQSSKFGGLYPAKYHP